MWKILALPWNLLWSKNFQYRRVEGMTRSPISRSFNFFRIASPMTFWSFYPPPISEANPKKKWSGSGRDLGQKSQSENFAGNKAFQSLSESSEKPSLLLLICWKVASSAERSQLVGRLGSFWMKSSTICVAFDIPSEKWPVSESRSNHPSTS